MGKESLQEGVDYSSAEQPSDPPQLFNIGQAAQMLHVGTQTLRTWDKKGILVPDIRFGGNRARRYTEETLLDFINDSCPEGRPPFDQLPEDLISIREAARILHVSIPTLRTWDRKEIVRPACYLGTRRDRVYIRSKLIPTAGT